jgi:hypothetical protein
MQHEVAGKKSAAIDAVCPGRGAAFFTLLRRAGTVTNAILRYGPGSAAQRKSHSASKTRVNALMALRPGHALTRQQRGWIVDPALCLLLWTIAYAAFWACASMSSAAFTFGRAATRSLNAIRFLNSDKSMPVRSAHFSITNR